MSERALALAMVAAISCVVSYALVAVAGTAAIVGIAWLAAAAIYLVLFYGAGRVRR